MPRFPLPSSVRLLALVALLLLLLPAGPAMAQGFVPGIEDLPLAPGLSAPDDAAVVFDAPSGRIVEVQATGTGPQMRVRTFYRETLPQLGWRSLGNGRWRRGEEMLELTLGRDAAGQVTVKFSLQPAAAAQP